MLAQPHGSFTPAWFSCSPTHCLRRFERSDCGCKGVSLCILRVVARKLPARFAASVFVARSPMGGGSHGAPAVWLGAKGTYPICPILRRRYLASLSLSRSREKLRLYDSGGKGGAPLWFCYILNSKIALISRECRRSRISSSIP